MRKVFKRTLTTCVLLLGLLTGIFPSSSRAVSTNTQPSDAEFTQQLVGKWKVALTDPHGVSINGTDKKKADGKFSSAYRKH